jgi:hypothetical protein
VKIKGFLDLKLIRGEDPFESKLSGYLVERNIMCINYDKLIICFTIEIHN